MKTRTAITRLTLTAALLLSAAHAKANAYMELISGSTTVQIEPGGAVVASGPYTDNFSMQAGDGAVFVGTIGSWSADIASGGESGGFNVTLTDNINNAGPGVQTDGLEIIFSSGLYNLGPGHYDFGASDGGGNSVTATISGYYNPNSEFGGGSLSSYEAASTLMGSWTLPTTLAANHQNMDLPISGNNYITEVMLLGGTTGPITPQQVTLNADASFTPFVAPQVPDGGVTAAMIGSVLLLLIGFRSKFGSQRR